MQRSVGARMGGWIAERFGNYSVTPGLLNYTYTGIAGQSFGAFITQGMSLRLIGEANDYVAKGLSGGRLLSFHQKMLLMIVKNHQLSEMSLVLVPIVEKHSFGEWLCERFCVRNSGANVVVEGIGDHGCEYMTGGIAVILGKTGRNFGAGMSGGVAYVYDPTQELAEKCNTEMVELFSIGESGHDEDLKELIEKHYRYTDSIKAKMLLDDWENQMLNFVKVYPTEYHKMMKMTEKVREEGYEGNELMLRAFELVVGIDVVTQEGKG